MNVQLIFIEFIITNKKKKTKAMWDTNTKMHGMFIIIELYILCIFLTGENFGFY